MKRYFRYLQRQPHYAQKIHAGFFAGIITLAIAGVWLYYQYGFWNDKYVIEGLPAQTGGDEQITEVKNNISESPLDVLKNIYNESIFHAKSINISPKTLMESSTTINIDAGVSR